MGLLDGPIHAQNREFTLASNTPSRRGVYWTTTTQTVTDFDIVAGRFSMLKRAHTNRLLPKRDLCSRSLQTMRAKLVRKFANILNGIDLTKISVGDVINVAPHQAAMLILEGWAEEAPHTPGRFIDLQSPKRTGYE